MRSRDVTKAAVGFVIAIIIGTVCSIIEYRCRKQEQPAIAPTVIPNPNVQPPDKAVTPDVDYVPLTPAPLPSNKRFPRRR